MSMLAERKQKQKWTLNPRGKYWSEDANKFGQKMLEKMGWSAGKGLGANEDGITEHVKQAYKNDTRGIGFDDKGDQWTKHEVDFTSLLENLSQNTTSDLKKPQTSLERKSQSSRARVHYHKFTRGKDLSRYSEKDLANVFGRKTLEKKQECTEETQETSSDNSDKAFGVITIQGGSMSDYFKNKLKSFSLSKPDYESDEERPSFGFGYAPNMDLPKQTNPDETITHQIPEETIKKKKKKTKVVINECFDNPAFTDFPDQAEHMAFHNPAFNFNSPQADKAKLDTIEEIAEEIPEDTGVNNKKKKKKSDLEAGEQDVANEIVEDQEEKKHLEEVNEKSKKKKSKRKVEEDLANIENSTTQDVELSVKKKKKSKKIDTQAVEQHHEDVEAPEIEKIDKSIKKKKKSKNNDAQNVEPLEQQPEIQELDTEKSSKRKKKCKNTEPIELYLDAQDENDQPPNKKRKNSFSSEPIKKKKKKGIDNPACTELDNGLDNPACTANSLQQNIEETIASMSNAIDEYQLELENKMNEKKVNAVKKEEKWSPKFKDNRRPPRAHIDNPRKSVKQIIKEQGKIKYNFQGSNLPQIAGYGIKR